MARERLTHPTVPVHRVELSAGSGGADVRVEFARYGDGPSVLVLHGAGGGWDQGVDWARRRLPQGRDVIAVSRFGYLGSTLPVQATTSQQATVYASLLDRLGLDRVDVAAVSAGSMTALRFAVEHRDRVRRLVLESPMLPTRRPVRLPPAGVYRVAAVAEPLLWALTRSPVLTRLAAGVPRRALDTAAGTELAEINATTFPLQPRVAGAVFDRAVAAVELYRNELSVETLTAPTLVVNATHAVLTPHDDAAAFVARLPDGRLVDIPTGGHVLIGNVERLRQLMADFLT